MLSCCYQQTVRYEARLNVVTTVRDGYSSSKAVFERDYLYLIKQVSLDFWFSFNFTWFIKIVHFPFTLSPTNMQAKQNRFKLITKRQKGSAKIARDVTLICFIFLFIRNLKRNLSFIIFFTDTNWVL